MSEKRENSPAETAAAPKTRRAFLTLAALGTVNSVANSVVAQGIEKESAADGGVAAIQPKRELDRVTPVTPPGSEGCDARHTSGVRGVEAPETALHHVPALHFGVPERGFAPVRTPGNAHDAGNGV